MNDRVTIHCLVFHSEYRGTCTKLNATRIMSAPSAQHSQERRGARGSTPSPSIHPQGAEPDLRVLPQCHNVSRELEAACSIPCSLLCGPTGGGGGECAGRM